MTTARTRPVVSWGLGTMLPWPIPNMPVRAMLPIENYIKVLGHAWGLPRMPPLMFSFIYA